MSEESGLNRRHFLTVATSVAGVAGLGFAAAPFVASFQPNARALALGSPVEVDIGKLEEGASTSVMWRGRPVLVVHRSPEMLKRMTESGAKLADPDSQVDNQPAYAQNDYRSIRPEILVLINNCTHLGCAPTKRFELAPADLGADWVGGFFCPCHGSKFDLAGRVYSNVPAPTNLVVPPYRFIGDNLILIGDDTGVRA
jgi:ubiquinol-cytochrome c reductase iron-sulfur subunit